MTGSGWYGLLAITREARQSDAHWRGMRPTHCPQDGTLLTLPPRGGPLHCVFCSYDVTGQDHP